MAETTLPAPSSIPGEDSARGKGGEAPAHGTKGRGAESGTANEQHPEIVDVWSRTTPKYRRRAWLFLVLSAVLFAGVGNFAFWLRTGEWFAPAQADYMQTLGEAFNWTSANQITLTDMLFYPINMVQVPMLVPIVGLTLGALISIPILTTILYRLPAALIFVAIVGFVAVMPWLALNILFACLFASTRKIRLRYVSALVGLLPIALYFFLAIRHPTSMAASLTPAEEIKLYLPWSFALIYAALVMAIVLGLAKLVNYRPGVIAPLLAVMFGLPVLLFESKIGHDELYYRVLEHDYGPLSPYYFQDRDVNEESAAVIPRHAAVGLHGGRSIGTDGAADWEPEFAVDGSDVRSLILETLAKFEEGRHEVIDACTDFIRHFPKSRYVPNVLYIKARALDMRLERESLIHTGRLVHYSDFPSPASRVVWTALLTRYPKSQGALVARLRLAQLSVREGRVGEGLNLLKEAEREYSAGEWRSGERSASGLRSMFRAQPIEARLGIAPERTLRECHKLAALLRDNREEGAGDAALAEWMRLDPRSEYYGAQLRRLVARYAGSALGDNLALAELLQEASRTRRMLALETFVGEQAGGDAAARALWELGQLCVEDAQNERAMEVFARLQAEHAGSVWGEEAARRVKQLARQRPRG